MINNLFLKLIVCPAVLLVADFLSPKLNFFNVGHILAMGWLLAFIGIVLDTLLIRRLSGTTLTWLDVASFTLVIWGAGQFFPSSYISFPGALFTGILLGFTEYLAHRSFLANQRREIV